MVHLLCDYIHKPPFNYKSIILVVKNYTIITNFWFINESTTFNIKKYKVTIYDNALNLSRQAFPASEVVTWRNLGYATFFGVWFMSGKGNGGVWYGVIYRTIILHLADFFRTFAGRKIRMLSSNFARWYLRRKAPHKASCKFDSKILCSSVVSRRQNDEENLSLSQADKVGNWHCQCIVIKANRQGLRKKAEPFLLMNYIM